MFYLIISILSINLSNAINIKDAMTNAYKKNLNLKTKEQEIRSLHEKYVQARSGYLPSLDANLNLRKQNISESGSGKTNSGRRSDGGSFNTGEIRLTQNVFRGFKDSNSIGEVDNEIRSKWFDFSSDMQELFKEVAKKYLEISAGYKIIETHKANVNSLKATYDSAVIRQKAGAETEAQVANAESELLGASAKIEEAIADINVKKAEFIRMTGIDAGYVNNPEVPTIKTDTLEKIINIALKNNPKIVGASYQYASSKNRIDKAQSGYYPEVDLYAKVDRTENTEKNFYLDGIAFNNNATNRYMTNREVGIQVKMNLYSGGASSASVREARAKSIESRVSVEKNRTEIIATIAESWVRYKKALAQIKIYTAQIKAAEQRVGSVQRELEAGTKLVFDLLRAKEDLLKSKLSLIEAKKDANIGVYGLLYLQGKLSEKDMKLPVKSLNFEEEYIGARKRFY